MQVTEVGCCLRCMLSKVYIVEEVSRPSTTHNHMVARTGTMARVVEGLYRSEIHVIKEICHREGMSSRMYAIECVCFRGCMLLSAHAGECIWFEEVCC